MPSKLIRTVFLLFPAFILTAAVYAQNSRGIYISPNNDGVKDALEFSLEIKDERYVQAWTFIVENEKGEIVRTISNKESRPEMETSSGIKGVMSSIWKMITRVKRGVDVPEKIRWDGLMDNGATAPDGKYFFYVTAEDDNKNTQTTGKMSFYIDNTPPEISADIVERGIVMSGGTSLLPGFTDLISMETGVPVILAESPLTCVAIGCGKFIEETKNLKNYRRYS